ncbi:hypothetical protein ACQP00_19855 [Dactylosporangium sp. CS-047395]|uniref:hypothetical protein n=1 Tax=Dactylosporangium sp. CS-047395 TaxID=3239936 RepID=UPI003D8D9328
MRSTGHGRETYEADALSVGIAALTATRLNSTLTDEIITALRALTEYRHDTTSSAPGPRRSPAPCTRGKPGPGKISVDRA